MLNRYELGDDAFWEVEFKNDQTLTTRWGRIGAEGREATADLPHYRRGAESPQ
jgi:predicted DNA-binding WGR domain protein